MKKINELFTAGMKKTAVPAVAVVSLFTTSAYAADSDAGIQIISATLMDEWREVANC
ncbi:hypothetical protein MT378_05665 [Psychrobacter sp. 16-Bac2893]